MSCGVPGMEDAGCLFLFGYNPADAHPIVARRILRAKEKGAKIIVADPRVIETARIADIYLPLKIGSNIAFLNAFANGIVTEGMADKKFIEEHTTGFDEWWETIKNYTPENTAEITGIDPEQMRAAARMYATAEPSSIICWGMGVCQHHQNVEAVHTCAAIACVSGEIRLVTADDVATQFLITTHTLPITFLLGELEGICEDVTFLGIQPATTEFFDPLSAPVRRAVDEIYDCLATSADFARYHPA